MCIRDRTRAGKCYRLYSKKFYDTMDESTIPEIQRTSLTSVILNLKCMGISNVLEFQYLDVPEERMILEALRQLYYFQAIDADGRVTPLGHQLVEFPLQPSLARTLIRSKQLSCKEAVLPIVAMLSVENVYVRPSNKEEAERALEMHRELAEAGGGTSDFSTLLVIYEMASKSGHLKRWCREHCVHWRAIKTAQSIQQQLESILHRQKVDFDVEQDPRSSPLTERVRQSLCYGLFGNVARLGASRRSFRTMDGHSTVAYIHPGSVLFGCENSLDWVIYFELIETAKTYMRTICPVRYSWVQDLLPQLHDVDVYRLSDCERKRQRDSENVPTEDTDLPPSKRASIESDAVERERKREALKQRAASAKERYLARKRAFQEQI